MAGPPMQHQPPDRHIRIPQTVHKRIEFIQYKLLSHNTLHKKILTPLEALILFIHKLPDILLDTLQIQNIPQGHFGRPIRIPPVRQIHNITEIIRYHPIVVEVFVDDLAHGAFGFYQYLWHEEKKDE